MMKHLYLTLPSNSPEFPENTPANFRVKLPNPIHLIGEWEMALVEIQYPFSWNNVKIPTSEKEASKSWVIMFTGKNWAAGKKLGCVIKIPPGHYNTVEELISIINDRVSHAKKKWRKNEIETEEVKKAALDALNGFGLIYDKIRKRAVVKLTSKEIRQCSFGPDLQYMFGFDREQSVAFQKSKNFAQYPPDLSAGFNTLFVYCNLIEHQAVGGSLVPLLRTVPIKGSFGQNIDRVFLSPHYSNLRTNTFDSIEIKICRDTGELVDFNFGKVILKVHLQKRK